MAGQFVAVANVAALTPQPIMTSPDGVVWTLQTAPTDGGWRSICYSPTLGLHVVVGSNGSMHSVDGVNWIKPAGVPIGTWFHVIWCAGLGLFVACKNTISVTGIMTSPDGINWTLRATPNRTYSGVAYDPVSGILICCCSDAITFQEMIHSVDGGVTWILTAPNQPTGSFWNACIWSPLAAPAGQFIVVGTTGANPSIMTCPDGINYVTRVRPANLTWQKMAVGGASGLVVVSPSSTNSTGMRSGNGGLTWAAFVGGAGGGGTPQWFGCCWSPDLSLFCAVGISGVGNRIMTSPDGADPWTLQASPADYAWFDVVWGDDGVIPGGGIRRRRHRGGEFWGLVPELANYLT